MQRAGEAAGGGGSRPGERFDEIEGFRGYLALWVAVGHALQLAGIGPSGPLLALALRGHDAVCVFIVVSGFVITHLLLAKREAYAPYVVRRFLRLYPVYLVCAVGGYLLSDVFVQMLTHAPVPSSPAWEAFKAERLARDVAMHARFGAHAVAHLTMLHGAVPDGLLPFSSKMFLPPAWSVSLEWQFYLVAPAVLVALRSRAATITLLVLATLALAAFRKGLLGTFDAPSMLPAAVGYFALGIGTRLLWSAAGRVRFDPLVISVLALGALYAFSSSTTPVLIWAVVAAYVRYPRDRLDSRLFRAVLLNPASAALGRMSYPLYLAHLPVMTITASLAGRHIPGLTQRGQLLACAIGVVATIPTAAALHHLIELPGMALGKRLARRLATSPAVAPAPATGPTSQ